MTPSYLGKMLLTSIMAKFLLVSIVMTLTYIDKMLLTNCKHFIGQHSHDKMLLTNIMTHIVLVSNTFAINIVFVIHTGFVSNKIIKIIANKNIKSRLSIFCIRLTISPSPVTLNTTDICSAIHLDQKYLLTVNINLESIVIRINQQVSSIRERNSRDRQTGK